MRCDHYMRSHWWHLFIAISRSLWCPTCHCHCNCLVYLVGCIQAFQHKHSLFVHLNNASDQAHFLKVMPTFALVACDSCFKWGDPSGVICSTDWMMLFLSCFSILLHSFITYVFITQWSPSEHSYFRLTLPPLHSLIQLPLSAFSFLRICHTLARDGLLCVLLTLDYFCHFNLWLWFDVSRTFIAAFYLKTFALLTVFSSTTTTTTNCHVYPAAVRLTSLLTVKNSPSQRLLFKFFALNRSMSWGIVCSHLCGLFSTIYSDYFTL